MRVLFLTNAMGVGGIEWNLLRLARELLRRGHKVVVGSRPGALTPKLVEAGARVVDLRFRLRDPVATVRDVRALRSVLRRERPDVVHGFSASSGLLLWLARPGGGRRGVPFITSVMGLQNSPDESMLRIRARLRLTALGARRVLLPSPAIERLAHDLMPGDERLASQVVQGIELEPEPDLDASRREVREELGLPADCRVVSTVGRLNASKSHELFVAAAHEVLATRDAHFLVVGGGELERALRAEVARRGVGGNVHLVGERHDVARILAASDVYVRPGVVEGFVGLTVLEAQALGVPVVSFDTEDVRVAVADGETGFLVPPGDTHALADRIAMLLDDEDLCRRVGGAGREAMRSTYSIEAIVDDLLRRYEAELGRPAGTDGGA